MKKARALWMIATIASCAAALAGAAFVAARSGALPTAPGRAGQEDASAEPGEVQPASSGRNETDGEEATASNGYSGKSAAGEDPDAQEAERPSGAGPAVAREAAPNGSAAKEGTELTDADGASPESAAAGEGDTPRAEWAADIVIVLDNSGSMKKNDPELLTRRVVLGFAESLSPESRLGLIPFDGDAWVALDLTSVGEPSFERRVRDSLGQIDYTGQRTNLPAGVERALYSLREGGRESIRQVVVLLTDGIVDVGDPVRDVEQARWLRESLAAEARGMGVQIFGVAFTEAADYQLIQALARTTGGEYFRAFQPEDIAEVFRQVSNSVTTSLRAGTDVVSTRGAHAIAWQIATAGLLVLLLAALSRGVKIALAREPQPPAVILPEQSPQAEQAPAAELRPVGPAATATFPVRGRIARVGRVADANDLVLPWATISGQHAIIEYREGSFYLRDLRSRNGSSVNGLPFSDPERREIREVVLRNRDRVRLGGRDFDFLVTALDGQEETEISGRGETGILVGRPWEPAAGEPCEDGNATSANGVIRPAPVEIHPASESPETLPPIRPALQSA